MIATGNHEGPNHENGIIILLVAVFLLGAVGAMAALSIDVVTLYTARSEAQLAADAAALAGARALANSGATSDMTDASMANAQTLAQVTALAVARQNTVGGVNLTAGEVNVSFGGTSPTDSTVVVNIKKVDLPTFFARIWGIQQVTVSASATAEAYNPSPAPGPATTHPPVAPLCVKPWLLPNYDPSNTLNPTAAIFSSTGTISTTTLLGWTSPLATPMALASSCGITGTCTPPLAMPAPWHYFPGDDATTFPHPTNSLPTSASPALTSNYQESIAGCIQIPISCQSLLTPANIDTAAYPNPSRNSDTVAAVNVLTHATATAGDADQIDPGSASVPFRFLAGTNNPIVNARGKDVMVSDSLVTVPVFDTATYKPAVPSVSIIGFVQLFLNPDGNEAMLANGGIKTTVVNLVGCGTGATGNPIIGNGASPVAVRLIAPGS